MPDGSTTRFDSLDGLRGVAAAVVVVFHIVISDRHAGAVYRLDHQVHLGVGSYLMNYTPLRLVWAGSEAVVVFYVLSGFVLALPFARGRAKRWGAFYPSRMIRLYLPAIASLFLAWITTLLVPRVSLVGASPWLVEHATKGTGFRQFLIGSTLMGGWGGLNTSLWSLRFEVVFSLALPIFLFLAAVMTKTLWIKVIAVLAVCVVWPLLGFPLPDAVYITVFALGVLMAYNIGRLEQLSRSVPPWGWALILLAAVCLLMNSWIVAGIDLTSRLRSVWISLASVGAALLVFAVAFCPTAKRWFSSRPVRWLGAISFSLYLTQEPIVVGLEYLTRDRQPLVVMLPLAFGAAILVGWLFYRAVERPTHELARRFGRSRQHAATPATVAAH